MTRRQILVTNDDGYKAQGIKDLANILKEFGEVTVMAPKYHQSGMSMAVDLGMKALAYKDLGIIDDCHWAYLDATPATCVKFALNYKFANKKPNVLVCGINHGSNSSMASLYSGTLGAAQEGTLNGILSIGVSLNTFSMSADFTAVRHYLPQILDILINKNIHKEGVFYNINFPNIPYNKIKGFRVAVQGKGHWEREFTLWDAQYWKDRQIQAEMYGRLNNPKVEEGETLYMMVGEFIDDDNSNNADHHLVDNGYITIVAHNIYNTDIIENSRLKDMGLECDF